MPVPSVQIGNCLRKRMLFLGTVAPWLLAAVLGSQGQGVDWPETPLPGNRSGDRSAASGRGKFTIVEDSMQCTWVARDVADTIRLAVHCQNPEARVNGGVTDIECEYSGRPQRCPDYQANHKLFWNQVGRALKRLQGKVCKDESALVKTPVCKRAPRSAHFKLDISTSVVSAQSGQTDYDYPPPPPPSTASTSNGTECAASSSRTKAEEKCSSRWVSLCAFFFSILEGDDC